MNQRLKTGLYFGIFCAITAFVTNWVIEPTSHGHVIVNIIAALVGDVIGGVLFSWLMSKFSMKKTNSV